jgi:hypothetical protein
MKRFITPSHKKTTLATLLVAMLSGAGAVNAQSDSRFLYRFGVDGKAKVPIWLLVNNIYGSWSDVGSPYSCFVWAQPESAVRWGDAFQQSRVCQQNQARDVTPIMSNPVLKTTKNGEMYAEPRTLNVTQYQSAVGALDYIAAERADAWGAWIDDNEHYGCASWSPSPDTVKLYENFTQNRDCSQDQSRTRQVYHVWASDKETPKRIDPDTQTIVEKELRDIQGKMDYVDGQSIKLWSAWSNVDVPHSCSVWGQNPSVVDLDQDYTQNRACLQDQSSSRDIYDVWKSGAETFLRTEDRAKSIDDPQSQQMTGTRDYITTTETRDWSAWSNSGGIYGCSTWSPSRGSVNLDEPYAQTRSCSLGQVSKRDIYNVWKSGNKTLLRTENRAQTIPVPQSQQMTGTRDYITTTETRDWSGWSNSGSAGGCAGWSPNPNTVNLDASFRQSRTCSQGQVSSRDIYYVWKSGDKTRSSTQSRTQNVAVTQYNSEVGTRDYVTGSGATAWSGWSNSGGAGGCAGWSPSPSSVNLDASFTQSNRCSQGQVSSRDIYNVWKSGRTTPSSTESRTDSVPVTLYNPAVGTRDYVTGSGAGGWSGWSNSGSPEGCSEWSPSKNSINLYVLFKQTRSCSQLQVASRPTHNVWKSGRTTPLGTESKSNVVGVSQSQYDTGKKDFITGTHDSGWTTWVNSGAPYSCGEWSPSTNTVLSGTRFTQNRTCTQRQESTKTTHTSWRSGIKTDLKTSYKSQGIPVAQNQSAYGTDVGVVSQSIGPTYKVGGLYGCTSYSPAPSSVNLGYSYSKSATCKQNWNRKTTSITSYNNAPNISSATYSPSTTSEKNWASDVGEKDFVTGTSGVGWTTWLNIGSVYSCGGWAPSTSTVTSGTGFSQKRTCTQRQESYNVTYNVWRSGRKTVLSSLIRSRGDRVDSYQNATGTKAPAYTWQNVSAACGSTSGTSYGWGITGTCTSPGAVRRFTENERCMGSGRYVFTYKCQ